jgi:hypothetical protein
MRSARAETMAMRLFPVLTLCGGALVLAACEPTVPNSAAGVGFGSYTDYMRERDAALSSGAPPPTSPLTTAPQGTSPTGFSTDQIGAAIDRADPNAPQTATAPLPAAPLPPLTADGTRPRGNEPATIRPESGEMAAVTPNNTGISDENDFGAVSARETIESDAERIARNRAQYQVDQPTAVPQRPGSTGPNIVDFALSTNHAPGTPVYRRSGLRGDATGRCGRYPSPDRAQEAFLDAGGPDRDRLGLDPDGDGFACSWDPRPFRTALQ